MSNGAFRRRSTEGGLECHGTPRSRSRFCSSSDPWDAAAALVQARRRRHRRRQPGGHRPRRRRRVRGPAAAPAPRCPRARGCSRACRRGCWTWGRRARAKRARPAIAGARSSTSSMPTTTPLFVINVDEGRRGYADHLRFDRRQLPQADGQLRRGHAITPRCSGAIRSSITTPTGTPFGWRAGMTAAKALVTLDADADAVCAAEPERERDRLHSRPADGDADGPDNVMLVDVSRGTSRMRRRRRSRASTRSSPPARPTRRTSGTSSSGSRSRAARQSPGPPAPARPAPRC